MMAAFGAVAGSHGVSKVVNGFFKSPMVFAFIIGLALWVTFLPVSSGGLGLGGTNTNWFQNRVPLDRLFPSIEVNGQTWRYFDLWYYLQNLAESVQGPSVLIRTTTNNLLGAFSALVSRFTTGDVGSAILGILFFGINIVTTLVNFVILVVQILSFPFFFVLRAVLLALTADAWNAYLNFLSFQIPYL